MADLVFHVHVKIVGQQYLLSLGKYFQKFPGCESVCDVVGKPCLQPAQGFVTKRAAAVNKALINAGDFCHVDVCRGESAVRQPEPENRFRLMT